MTPTEQDKELREKINSYLDSVFSQGVRAGKDVATNTYEDFDAWRKKGELDEIMQLITADRKRVALEARIDEALIADRNLGQYPDYHKMKTASLKRIDDIERGLFISVHDLKAQQEEV